MNSGPLCFNTLRPRQNGCRFPDDIFICIFVNENFQIWNIISLKFVLKGLINNIPALVQKMAWRRPGDKPLSEPMMARSPTHICVTRPQWVKRTVVLRSCKVSNQQDLSLCFCSPFDIRHANLQLPRHPDGKFQSGIFLPYNLVNSRHRASRPIAWRITGFIYLSILRWWWRA